MFALMFAFGTFTPIFLDWLIIGTVASLYPLNIWAIGLDLVSLFVPTASAAAPQLYKLTLLIGFDAMLLVCWLLYEEWKKKIQDYI